MNRHIGTIIASVWWAIWYWTETVYVWSNDRGILWWLSRSYIWLLIVIVVLALLSAAATGINSMIENAPPPGTGTRP